MKNFPNKESNESTIPAYLVIISALGLLAMILVLCAFYLNFSINEELAKDQQNIWVMFGEFFGGTLSPILAFLALIALLWSIKIQRKELHETVKTLEFQNNLIQKQNFEATFFHLLKLYNETIKELSVTLSTKTFEGRAVIGWFYQELEDKLCIAPMIGQARENQISTNYSLTYEHYGHIIERYNSAIFNILKFIDNYDPLHINKRIYTDILWGQFSRIELLLFFYTSASEFREMEMRLLARKYGFFEYIRKRGAIYNSQDLTLAIEFSSNTKN